MGVGVVVENEQAYFYRVMAVAKECHEQRFGVLMVYLSLIWAEVDERMFFFVFL